MALLRLSKGIEIEESELEQYRQEKKYIATRANVYQVFYSEASKQTYALKVWTGRNKNGGWLISNRDGKYKAMNYEELNEIIGWRVFIDY